MTRPITGPSLLAAIALLGGCATNVRDSEVAVAGISEPPISFEEFRDSAYREPEPYNKFIVDGDIALSDEDALRDYYESYRDRSTSLTVRLDDWADNVWSFPTQMQLTYCIGTEFKEEWRTQLVAAMHSASASWHDRVGVRFEHVSAEDDDCNAQNTRVLFNVSKAPLDARYEARAFWPNEPRAERNVLVANSAFYSPGITNPNLANFGLDLEQVLRHELGHMLGFRHEHIWLDNPPSLCRGYPSPEDGPEDARALTEYDEGSVMHYPQCRESGEMGYAQTELDYRGAISIYGLAPALTVALAF